MSVDLSDLYQEIILGHNRRPRNEEVLEPSNYKAEGFNPLCGDRITVYARADGAGRIERVTFVGEGCAISRASASIMTTQVQGRTISEISQRISDVIAMLSQPDDPEMDLAVEGDLAALAGVRKFPARIKCATLSWHALRAAIEKGSDAIDD
ncbi:MAG: SUF system NifU family Fe-S cluster assembly protein [Verrucomicrobia bacterium]|nr:SUF system NifU family Fe-S cluster assembly protein [Verrucomicrobiota bacterium]